MLFKSRRFVEYYPGLALIFLALAAEPIVSGWLSGVEQRSSRPRLVRLAAPLVLAALMALPMVRTLGGARDAMRRSQPPMRYAWASTWLKANSAPGSLACQTDWGDFPRLFFHNSHNLDTAGLDPTYLELCAGALYAEWVELTRGGRAPPGSAIRDDFGAQYALSDLKHGDFIRAAADDPSLREVYRDDEAVVYQVLDKARNFRRAISTYP